MNCPFVRWDSKKLVATGFSIAARAMDGVGGGLFAKANLGGEQSYSGPPLIRAFAVRVRGKGARGMNSDSSSKRQLFTGFRGCRSMLNHNLAAVN